MAVDNFKLIRPLLTFESEDDFYFVQILQRKKDNPGNINGSNNSSRLIKAYYINSIEKFDRLEKEMKFFADYFNARVGINLNKRSYYKTAFNTMKTMAEQMHNKNFKTVHRAWNTACGVHNGGDKIWLLDVDKITDLDILAMFDNPDGRRHNLMVKCINDSQPTNKEKIIANIPSKSGYHLITYGFDTRKFVELFPEIEIHKNNPTNLYIPSKKVYPNHGGCWFCYSAEGDMLFDTEFDTFVHEKCLRKALEDGDSFEAPYMEYLLEGCDDRGNN